MIRMRKLTGAWGLIRIDEVARWALDQSVAHELGLLARSKAHPRQLVAVDILLGKETRSSGVRTAHRTGAPRSYDLSLRKSVVSVTDADGMRGCGLETHLIAETPYPSGSAADPR